MKKLYIVILFSIIITNNLLAQDPQFSQFYANPLYLNPALAGTNLCPRVNLNYRNQWPGISGTYVTTSASFDKYIYKLKGGLGFLVTNDRAGQGTINTTNVSAIYSYQVRFTRYFSMNFGVQATYGQKNLDVTKLTFGDMTDDRNGFVRPANLAGINSHKSFADFSAGTVAFSKRLYAGVAVNHLTQPDEGFISVTKLPMKITGHAGAVFHLNGERGDATISPNIIYQQQQNFKQLDFGLYATKGVFVGGLWYRNNDSFILLVGFQKSIFKFGYSYDITVSKLTNATAGAHELSLGFLFKCKKPKPRYRPGICPIF